MLNVFLAKMMSVNGSVREWEYQNQLRLYLIKSYRGRALALGKPSRGQRTWSNARTARNRKSLFRSFVTTLRGEQARKASALAKRGFRYRMRMRSGRRRVRRQSKRQKRMQLKIDGNRLWF
jgi:hypothetical protein